MSKGFTLVLLMSFFIIPYKSFAAETIIIKNIPIKVVHKYLVDIYLKNELIVKAAAENYLKFEDNAPQSIDFVLTWGEYAKVLHIYHLIKSQEDTMLTLEIQIVVNFGRCDQRIYALTYQNILVYPQVYREYLNDGIKDTKEMMSSIKTYFNGGYSYGFRVVKGAAEGYVWITNTIKNLPAVQAGLQAGDRIIKLNNEPIRKLKLEVVAELLTDSETGAVLKLIVCRGERKFSVNLTKQYMPPGYNDSFGEENNNKIQEKQS